MRGEARSVGWEGPVAVVVVWLVVVVLLLPGGQGIVAWLVGGGWVWPDGGRGLGASVGGLLAGDSGRGLSPAEVIQVPVSLAVFGAVALVELVWVWSP
jgi:hypothetical protein